MINPQTGVEEVELERLEAAIEAILFTMGNSVELSKIAAAIEHDEETTRKIIRNLMLKYDRADRGIKILELEGSYQLCTKEEYFEQLIRVASQPKRQALTETMLETLSIIAYKQPITRIEIEKIRGVKSDHAVNRLIEYGLIEEVGRLDAPGRPILFATTEEFLRSFGISSLGDLPQASPEMVEEFKEEAEEEIEVET
ncbi:SMC-Scp complex subunit ScpB [Cuneatibacter caecimuris]|uniref:Segregation and condensation protein B n=1 Tax=Cuneatibacter caecimuris TaxID=1796618 RepID=A0A4Q7PJZ1_9FIRM|nr:SMC-Scp complex subunit ScpB [Cuneatibacter caecimuris]RZT01021.1 segregation and condensation protein B [Cuneatibacter caecimuris]